jgi:hypothetical protein
MTEGVLAIIRTKKDKDNPYVVINKEALENTELSAKAKGIFSYLMCKPDDWQIYISELIKHFKGGKYCIAKGINELEKAGYITKKQIRDESGTFKCWDYTVYESPKAKNQSSVAPKPNYPKADNPKAGNSPILSNDIKLNNDITNMDDDFNTFWKIYNKKHDFAKCKAKWKRLSVADKKAILEYIPKYVAATPDKQYRRYPTAFFNNRTWENELPESKEKSAINKELEKTDKLLKEYSNGL